MASYPRAVCQHCPGQLGTVLILRGISPPFPGCCQSTGFGSRLASSRMHPRADRRDFPLHGMSVLIIPRSRVPVGQDGFKLRPNYQPKSFVSIRKGLDIVASMPTCPCGCPQKMLRAGCGLVIIPSEVPMTTAAWKTPALVAHRKLPEFTWCRERAV